MKHVLAVSAGLAAMVSAANVLFEEDFTNYRDHAPGTAVTEELSVSNDPIHRRRVTAPPTEPRRLWIGSFETDSSSVTAVPGAWSR